MNINDQRSLAGELGRVGAIEEARDHFPVEALHLYQFGFDITSSWGYQLLLRSTAWLLALGSGALVLLSCILASFLFGGMLAPLAYRLMEGWMMFAPVAFLLWIIVQDRINPIRGEAP